MTMIDQIDVLLPQTQCGQCSYAGCKPYAEAIVLQDEVINRCPPGGVKTLKALGNLLQRDVTPYLAQMQQQEKPAQLAVIREAECIGCTKCIQACPVDAIVGAAKQLHTVLTAECTGCGLCVAPCPVDCIDLINVEKLAYQPAVARVRYNAKQARGKKISQVIDAKAVDVTPKISDKKAYIQAALDRVKKKRSHI